MEKCSWMPSKSAKPEKSSFDSESAFDFSHDWNRNGHSSKDEGLKVIRRGTTDSAIHWTTTPTVLQIT